MKKLTLLLIVLASFSSSSVYAHDSQSAHSQISQIYTPEDKYEISLLDLLVNEITYDRVLLVSMISLMMQDADVSKKDALKLAGIRGKISSEASEYIAIDEDIASMLSSFKITDTTYHKLYSNNVVLSYYYGAMKLAKSENIKVMSALSKEQSFINELVAEYAYTPKIIEEISIGYKKAEKRIKELESISDYSKVYYDEFAKLKYYEVELVSIAKYKSYLRTLENLKKILISLNYRISIETDIFNQLERPIKERGLGDSIPLITPSSTILLNGVEVGRTKNISSEGKYVPLKEISEILDIIYEQNKSASIVYLKSIDPDIYFEINTKTGKFKSRENKVNSTEIVIKDGVVLISKNFLSEQLGIHISVDNESKLISLVK